MSMYLPFADCKKITELFTSEADEVKLFDLTEPDEPEQITFILRDNNLTVVAHEGLIPAAGEDENTFVNLNIYMCDDALESLIKNYDLQFPGYEKYPDYVRLNEYIKTLTYNDWSD